MQFVRKISGYNKPSKVNEAAFNQAVSEISVTLDRLLTSLMTGSPPRGRAAEIEHARQRFQSRD